MTLKRVELDGDAVIIRVKQGDEFADLIFVRSPTPTLKNVWEQLPSHEALHQRDKV